MCGSARGPGWNTSSGDGLPGAPGHDVQLTRHGEAGWRGDLLPDGPRALHRRRHGLGADARAGRPRGGLAGVAHTRASDGGWRAAEPTDGCPTRISPHCVSRSSALDSRPRDTLGGGTWRIGHHADRSPVPHGRLPMMGGSPWSSSPIPPAPCARSPCTPATAGHPSKARSSISRVGLVREGSPSTRRAEVFAGASTPESERGIANGHQFVGSPCDGRHERDWIWCSGGSWGCRWTRRFGIPGSSPRSGNAC